MPTNVFSAIVLSALWLTNYPPVADGPRGDVWYRTNIVSLRTIVAVVGPGIPAVTYTNEPVSVSTNVRRFEIVETLVPAPIVSGVVTSYWGTAKSPFFVSGHTNGPPPVQIFVLTNNQVLSLITTGSLAITPPGFHPTNLLYITGEIPTPKSAAIVVLTNTTAVETNPRK